MNSWFESAVDCTVPCTTACRTPLRKCVAWKHEVWLDGWQTRRWHAL